MGERKLNSTNMLNETRITQDCDSIYAICKIGGRWKMMILHQLKNGTLRFGELRDAINGITERMLTLQLKELEKDGLIIRTVYAQVPPKVEYNLSPIACELLPIWLKLDEWGAKHRELMK
ncbi:winged helix-turn-helix transcriptional regulator [Pedobacter antarcticus]|uniref:Transcriptional regulator n=2 Tax=Pedobacter antarcticus TaxID=34086 RepID=A0A081PCB7_9SPHI|nr:helix-turn-helix domain-containing protein [Pedobacter antarcticus]KEQ28340.1 transcriptional regulator [Pedobacter antarcticus 4BY]